MRKTSFAEEGFHERSAAQNVCETDRDAAPQIDTARRHDLQGQIARLGAEDGNEQIYGFPAEPAGTDRIERRLDDDRSLVLRPGELFRDPVGLRREASLLHVFIDIGD